MTAKTRIDDIYETVLPEMEAQDIEDTPENRFCILKGLAERWLKDHSFTAEKSLNLVAINIEIAALRRQLAAT